MANVQAHKPPQGSTHWKPLDAAASSYSLQLHYFVDLKSSKKDYYVSLHIEEFTFIIKNTIKIQIKWNIYKKNLEMVTAKGINILWVS